MANFIVNDIKNSFRNNNYLTIIIIVNVGIYILQNIITALTGGAGYEFILEWFGISADLKKSGLRFWSYFTYMFFHSNRDIFHVIFNMLWLYWIGRIFAEIYGNKRFLNLYLIGGVFAGIFFALTALILQAIGSNFIPAEAFLIGASGGVMAIIVGTATLQPDYEMQLFILGRVKLKYIALGSFILTTVLDFNLNTGGKLAHLGGALFGFIYGQNLKLTGKEITYPINQFFGKITGLISGKQKMRVVYKKPDTQSAQTSEDLSKKEIQRKTDEILDKINKSGYNSLTREEKDFLTKVSEL